MRASLGGTVSAMFHSSSIVSGPRPWVLLQQVLDSLDGSPYRQRVASVDVPGNEIKRHVIGVSRYWRHRNRAEPRESATSSWRAPVRPPWREDHPAGWPRGGADNRVHSPLPNTSPRPYVPGSAASGRSSNLPTFGSLPARPRPGQLSETAPWA